MKYVFAPIGDDSNPDITQSLVQIDQDRYCGCYSGAEYTAWPGLRPDDIDAGDLTCEEFWSKYENSGPKWLHGRGQTPQEAFKDLLEKSEGRVGIGLKFVDLTFSNQAFLYQSDDFKKWLNIGVR